MPTRALVRPDEYRRSLILVAALAVATWVGIGLPYSMMAWLLDARQLEWTLICYAWEVPVFGIVGMAFVPLLLWRRIEREWNAITASVTVPPSSSILALERRILDYPLHVAIVFLVTSLLGYTVGAAQIHIFAQLPPTETVKVCCLGVGTGLFGGLFAYLYLDWRLGPLLQQRPFVDLSVPPTSRRVSLYAKVFACSLILTLTALLLLGTILYSRGERILEEEIGRRVLAYTHQLVAKSESTPFGSLDDSAWWRTRETTQELGSSGTVQLIADDGTILRGAASPARALIDQGFRPETVARILRDDSGYLVERMGTFRVVAFAHLGARTLRAVAVVPREEFEGELDGMLRRGGVVFAMVLLLALVQGSLFSHRITHPIEIVTRMATGIARAPGGRG